MLMPNTSLLLAGRDLHLLDETRPEAQPEHASTPRRSRHARVALVRLANRIAALFL